MKIKGAIFDMDGTLVDSLMFWDYLWEQIGIRYFGKTGFRPDKEVDKKTRTMIYTDAMLYFKEYYKIPCGDEEFLRFTTEGIGDFYINEVRLKKGAIEFLEHLKHSGVRMCLASATDMGEIRLALKRFDLEKYFDAVYSCADIGVGKDRPDIYLLSMKTLGFPAEDICVFEDSFVALETAKAVGFKTVGLYDRYNFEQERLKNASEIYIDKDHSMLDLLEMVNPQENSLYFQKRD